MGIIYWTKNRKRMILFKIRNCNLQTCILSNVNSSFCGVTSMSEFPFVILTLFHDKVNNLSSIVISSLTGLRFHLFLKTVHIDMTVVVHI